MGLHRGSAGASIIVFHAFAWQLLADQPDVILLECTPAFQEASLDIFEKMYHIQCLTFSPCSLGFPASRPRKYMLLMHRRKTRIIQPFNKLYFGNLFYRKACMSPDEFLIADDTERYAEVIDRLRKQRGLPELNHGHPWLLPEVLAPGMAVHLRCYKELFGNSGEETGWVNLGQSATFMSKISTVVPTLLQASQMYSLKQDKVMMAKEHLLVMGVPTVEEKGQRLNVSSFPLKITQDATRSSSAGSITERQAKMLSGNGVHLAAVGTCMMFLFSQDFCKSESD